MEREDPEHGAAVAVARRTVRHPTELTDPAVGGPLDGENEPVGTQYPTIRVLAATADCPRSPR